MVDRWAAGESGQDLAPRSSPWLGKLAVLLAVALAIWLPCAPALDRFVTPDENAWSGRSQHFLTALREGDYALTFQTEHPGVTTMWAGAAGRLWNSWIPGGGSGGWAEGDPNIAAGRVFAVLANTLALSLAFVFAWRLLGLLPALLGFLLLSLDPFHAAHARILHLDGMLSSFLLLALMAFLSFLRHRRPLDLIVSGVAAGLSWLTKSPGLFLIPIVLLLALIELGHILRERDGRPLATLIWQSVWPLIVWGLAGLAVFVLLWPAMWVEPLGTVNRVLAPALGHAQGGHGDPVFFGGRLYADGRLDASVWQFYPVSYLWRSTPVALLGLLAAGVALVFRCGPLARPDVRRVVLGLLLFVLLYGLLLNLGAKKFDRYLLPAFAPLDLVAALGWVAVAGWVASAMRSAPANPEPPAGIRQAGRRDPKTEPGSRKVGSHASLREVWPAKGLVRSAKPARLSLALLLLGIVILAQAAFSLPTYPYYLSYYNPLLGGGPKAPEVLMIGWGEGLDQAGRYLSAKPEAKQLQVASWYVPCFAPFFPGAVRGIPLETELSDPQLEELLASDYIVVYIHQWQREMPRPLLEVLAGQAPEHRIEINGVEYARIYQGPLSERRQGTLVGLDAMAMRIENPCETR